MPRPQKTNRESRNAAREEAEQALYNAIGFLTTLECLLEESRNSTAAVADIRQALEEQFAALRHVAV